MTKLEEWRDVAGYSGRYQVSSHGNVRSTKNGLLKCPVDRSTGYKVLMAYDKDKPKKLYVHRLVAVAFIPNPDSKPQVDHINTIRSDNMVANLRWVTHSENRTNPQTIVNRIGIAMSANGRRKISQLKRDKGKPVLQFTAKGDFVNEYPGARTAERATGVGCDKISRACNGVYKTGGGYVWIWKEDNYDK